MNNQYLSRESFKVCRNITRKFGTSYFLATSLFPARIRKPTWVVYAFLRNIDEIVDTQIQDGREASQAINQALVLYEKSLNSPNEKSVLGMMAIVSKQFSFDPTWVTIFFDSMLADTHVYNYETYEDIEKYMEGSASVVGYMMSSIIGYEKDALVYAQKLGQAMQLTNFLRDIKEDYERGRVYLPKEWLLRFGVTENQIKNGTVNENWVNLMKYAISFNRDLYKESKKGIALLNKSGQKQVYASLLLYSQILNEIEKQNYDVFSKRASVPTYKKILLLLKSFCYNPVHE